MFTLVFWKAATERAVKTAAQTLLAVYLVGDVAFNAFQADWGNMAGIAAGAAFLSYLTSLGSAAGDGNPSAINAEVTPATVEPGTGKHVA